MIGVALAVLAQSSVSVPIAAQNPPADPSRPHSIVVATTVRQTDPRPIPCSDPPCTSWFKAEFEHAVTIAGPLLPGRFVADHEMGSPFDKPYELVWIVEHRADGTQRINDAAGFDPRTREACFGPEIASLFPGFEAVARLVRRHKAICVKER
jgi:hypothetical protein